MPNRTLAIVFRNPHPQRSPIRTELYLFRRDGSAVHIDYANQDEPHQPEESTAACTSGSAVGISHCYSLLRTKVRKALQLQK
jgi:hypothetical protein